MYKLFENDNVDVMEDLLGTDIRFDLCYSDPIYENKNFGYWMDLSVKLLKPNAIMIVQTDYHTVAEMKVYLDTFPNLEFVDWCIFINDWGGTPKKGFPRKHDDILIYANGSDWKWDKSVIEIPKATAGTKFDKKGTGMKTPCDVFYDHASFSTVSSERIKDEDGHCLRWQKPKWLMERILKPFLWEGATVLDNFMGTASLGEVCLENKWNYFGIENDPKVFEIAKNRLESLSGLSE